MCLGIPGEIVKIEGSRATVNILGVTREISVALLEKVQTGDYVIVHAGCAISVIDEQDAQELIELFRELGVTEDE